MLSGVSPCAICHAIVPLFMSIAVMRPYGGLMIGSPITVRLPPPSPPPPPPPPGPPARPPLAPCGIGEPAALISGGPLLAAAAPRPPPPAPRPPAEGTG